MERVVDPLAIARQPSALRRHAETIAFVVMVAALIVAPFFTYPLFLMQAMCFALFACAFNLLIGYVGLLSFGHALYFGWASYLSAYSAKVWGFPPELAILTGTATAAVCGLLAGSLAIRRQGIYFAMITLALAQMMYFFALQAKFTGGEDGIQAVPRGYLFGIIDLRNEMAMYVVVLVIFLAGFLFIYRIIHSPFGEVLKAIRENETRAISLGYKTDRYKLVAFVLSATLAGVAGATKAIVLQLASLTDVNWPMSGEVVLMTLVGGLGTIFGPVVGSFVILLMQYKLAPVGEWVLVIQGVIFVACVLLFRRGIIGELANKLRIRHQVYSLGLALLNHWRISLHGKSYPQTVRRRHCASPVRPGPAFDDSALATDHSCRQCKAEPASMTSRANGAIWPSAGWPISPSFIAAAAGSITTRRSSFALRMLDVIKAAKVWRELAEPASTGLGPTSLGRTAGGARRRSAPGGMNLARTILAAAVALAAAMQPATAADDLKLGETLLTRDCGSCHAVGRTGDSPRKDAPAFRTLGTRYPVESLEEALGEGIMSGHPDMPEFKFDADDVGAIIAYLKSIQQP